MGTGCSECCGRPLTLAALALAVLRLSICGCFPSRSIRCQGSTAAKASPVEKLVASLVTLLAAGTTPRVTCRCWIASSYRIAPPFIRPGPCTPPGPTRRSIPLATAPDWPAISPWAGVLMAMGAGPTPARSLWPSWGPCCWAIGWRSAAPWPTHAANLGHWLELLKESPRVLLQVLSDARKAADLICPEKVDGQEISDLEMSLT